MTGPVGLLPSRGPHFTSTSAGAMAGSRSATPRSNCGSFTISVFQPRWTSTPEKGAGPAILPTSRYSSAEYPAGTCTVDPSCFCAYRIDSEVFLQDACASGVNDPGGCPDLGIVIGVDIVHQEIDQPSLFLEHRQEVDDFGVRAARLQAVPALGGPVRPRAFAGASSGAAVRTPGSKPESPAPAWLPTGTAGSARRQAPRPPRSLPRGALRQ